MPTCQNKNVGSWLETSIWQSAKSRFGSKMNEWKAKRTAKELQTGSHKVVTTAIIIHAVRVREVTPVITPVTLIIIQVTQGMPEVTFRQWLMRVTIPLFITILIWQQQPPVILNFKIANRYIIKTFVWQVLHIKRFKCWKFIGSEFGKGWPHLIWCLIGLKLISRFCFQT